MAYANAITAPALQHLNELDKTQNSQDVNKFFFEYKDTDGWVTTIVKTAFVLAPVFAVLRGIYNLFANPEVESVEELSEVAEEPSVENSEEAQPTESRYTRFKNWVSELRQERQAEGNVKFAKNHYLLSSLMAITGLASLAAVSYGVYVGGSHAYQAIPKFSFNNEDLEGRFHSCAANVNQLHRNADTVNKRLAGIEKELSNVKEHADKSAQSGSFLNFANVASFLGVGASTYAVYKTRDQGNSQVNPDPQANQPA